MDQQIQTYSRPNSKQRGDLLIESLIGMVLMAIIGMGVVMVTSKMSVSQKDMRMQEIAVNQMRAYLMNHGNGAINVCSNPPLNVNLPGIGTVPTQVQGCATPVAATVNGVPIAGGVQQPLIMSVTHAQLGGQVVVGGTWSQ